MKRTWLETGWLLAASSAYKREGTLLGQFSWGRPAGQGVQRTRGNIYLLFKGTNLLVLSARCIFQRLSRWMRGSVCSYLLLTTFFSSVDNFLSTSQVTARSVTPEAERLFSLDFLTSRLPLTNERYYPVGLSLDSGHCTSKKK